MMEVISKKQAKAKGLTYYFTGKPCKNGHIDKRYVASSVCLSCRVVYEAKQRDKKWASKKVVNAPKGFEKITYKGIEYSRYLINDQGDVFSSVSGRKVGGNRRKVTLCHESLGSRQILKQRIVSEVFGVEMKDPGDCKTEQISPLERAQNMFISGRL